MNLATQGGPPNPWRALLTACKKQIPGLHSRDRVLRRGKTRGDLVTRRWPAPPGSSDTRFHPSAPIVLRSRANLRGSVERDTCQRAGKWTRAGRHSVARGVFSHHPKWLQQSSPKPPWSEVSGRRQRSLPLPDSGPAPWGPHAGTLGPREREGLAASTKGESGSGRAGAFLRKSLRAPSRHRWARVGLGSFFGKAVETRGEGGGLRGEIAVPGLTACH